MYSIKLDLKDSIYDKFMSFLNNIPKDEIQIKEIKKSELKDKSSDDLASLGGILNSYADLSKLDLEKDIWQRHIEDKYK